MNNKPSLKGAWLCLYTYFKWVGPHFISQEWLKLELSNVVLTEITSRLARDNKLPPPPKKKRVLGLICPFFACAAVDYNFALQWQRFMCFMHSCAVCMCDCCVVCKAIIICLAHGYTFIFKFC